VGASGWRDAGHPDDGKHELRKLEQEDAELDEMATREKQRRDAEAIDDELVGKLFKRRRVADDGEQLQ
jgi:hypothetical protein